MKNYNKNGISSFLQYLDANNFYGLAISKKLPAGKFKWAKKASIYKEQAIRMYNENDDYGAILGVDVEYPTMTRIKHKDLPFLPQRKKINKVHKLVTTLNDIETYLCICYSQYHSDVLIGILPLLFLLQTLITYLRQLLIQVLPLVIFRHACHAEPGADKKCARSNLYTF